MKRTLDLRTGRPVWSAYRAPTIPTSPLRHDVRTEVLVVGMGISGAMVAEALTAAGLHVVVIDRRGPLLGSTSASTALVQYDIDVPLARLAKMIGRDAAERAWRRSRLSVANLTARIDELGIACDAMYGSSLLLAGDTLDADGLRVEAQARRAAGLYAEFLDRRTLRERFGLSRAGAILSPGNLGVDPRKLTARLLLAAIERGARCHAPTEATKFTTTRNGVEVETVGGPGITAAAVVLATGYELTALVPADGHRVVSTYAIATKPQPRALWPERMMLWEASDPYLYVRATPDGRVICGGEDEPFADEVMRDSLLADKAARIAAKLGKLLPDLDPTPRFAWTGSFGTTKTGLPWIGRLPGRPRIHAVLGYGGNGITFSRIAAEIVRAELTGARDADAELFAFPK